MPVPRSTDSLYRPFVILGSLVLIVAVLFWAQSVIIPLVLALLLAFILSPAVIRLQHWGLWRVPAVILVVMLALMLVGSIGLAISYQIRNLASEVPQLQGQIAGKITALLQARTGSAFDQVKIAVEEISKDWGYSLLRGALVPAAEGLATTALVIVLLIFILIGREDVRNRLVRLVGRGQVIVTTRALDEAAQRISNFLLTQLLINATFGVALGIGLALIGVPYALFWGFLGALLRFVPYLGVWLAALLVFGFSIAIFGDWTSPLLVLGLFAVLEVITFNVMEPLLFGHRTGISPVALLMAAVFWAWLWGPIGLLLSTPLTACMAVLGRYVPQLGFFHVLLSSEPALDAELTYYQRLLARDQDEATDLVEAFLQDHEVETVYDEVFIPALVLTKRDRKYRDLTRQDEEFILGVTRDVLNDLVSPQMHRTTPERECEPMPSERTKVSILCCPARDAEDELALQMFRQLLQGVHCQVEVLSAQTLSGELVTQVEHDRPDLVCIAALPPGGVSLSRYLCKRLRSHFPDLKILVGRWGSVESIDKIRERLTSAGADAVAASLLESRNQVVPLIQVLAHVKAQPKHAPLEPATAQ